MIHFSTVSTIGQIIEVSAMHRSFQCHLLYHLMMTWLSLSNWSTGYYVRYQYIKTFIDPCVTQSRIVMYHFSSRQYVYSQVCHIINAHVMHSNSGWLVYFHSLHYLVS